jgi:hypothetical protein
VRGGSLGAGIEIEISVVLAGCNRRHPLRL